MTIHARSALLRFLVTGFLLVWGQAALADQYTIPLFVSAGTSGAPQGMLRILNSSGASGTVEIYAINDTGTRSGPVTFTLNASAAVEFNATDLESGNVAMGLSGGIGADVGDARLEIETDLRIVPLAYVRAADGTLSAMHDTVRAASVSAAGQYRYDVPIFNLSADVTQVSQLRLINPGDRAAAVTIEGRDDSGAEATGGSVQLTLAARGAQTLTAQQLEAGDTGLTGQLGAGVGKWRLSVSADQAIQVVNIVVASAGYSNNLSTTAVPGAAPADHAAFNERFVGVATEYRTDSGVFTLHAMTDERFTESEESDGVTTTDTGGYDYEGIGPDAGRLTLTYDDGDVCAANLYFSSLTAGWLASRCTGSDYPADGSWSGGTWSAEDADDMTPVDPVDPEETSYGAGDEISDLPAGAWFPDRTSGGSVAVSGGNTVVRLNNGGFVEESDYRYTCQSAAGCEINNRQVVSGTIVQTSTAAMPANTQPTFAGTSEPGDQTYTVGTAIDALTLPTASGGDGTLTYSLTSSVPGLRFDAATRQLTGTPTTAGSYIMTYNAEDEDGDSATRVFTITVSPVSSGTGGDCYVGLVVRMGESCTYPGTTDAFTVNERGRGSFLTFLAGIRIRINNQTINGRVYDMEASHQGDGVWRIDRVAGSTEPPTSGGTGGATDTSPSFAAGSGPGNRTYTVGTAIATLTLPEASGGDGSLTYNLSPNVPGLTFNDTRRQLTGAPSTAGSYAMTYTVTDEDGDTDTLSFTVTVEASDDGGDGDGSVAGGFDWQVDDGNGVPAGIAYVNGRLYVVDESDNKVYAYTESGQRDAATDFDLDPDNSHPSGITYANGRFYVVDDPRGADSSRYLENDNKVYAYTQSGQRDAAADFDLDGVNGSPADIVYANARFYVPDWLDDKVYAYTASGERDAAADFDFHADNGYARAMTYANGRFYVVDGSDRKVYAYTESGERDAAADFDSGAFNFSPKWIAYANGRFYVVNWYNLHVYAYTDSGERDAAAEFPLPGDNQAPWDIVYVNGRFYVLDTSDYKVYAYTQSGQRDTAAEFDLHADNYNPYRMTYANGRFYVGDGDKVYAYADSGERDAAADFDLHADNGYPIGMTYANGRFYVVDADDDKVYAYADSGERDAAADFLLHEENSPGNITYANGRFYVEGQTRDKVFAYTQSGQRDAAADFRLHDDNHNPFGISYADGRFYVLDTRLHKVFAYPGPGGQVGGETSYGVGDSINTLPTGTWFPDLIRGGVSFRISGGSAAIDFGNGGYVEEGSYRYTCASAGGCQVRGREVLAGTIVQTPSGVAPEEIPPTSGIAGTCDVALGRSAGAGGTETVSVALSDAIETDVGTLDTPFVVRARMDSASDFDVYRIVLSEAGRLVVLSSGALDTQAVFLRSDCTEAGRVVEDVGVVEGFAANNYNFTLGGDLDPGTYYIVVFEWASRIGNYALELGFASDDGVNDTPVIEPVAHQEVAPGGTVTVDVQITDDTGDAHAVVATSDNEDVATADLRGSGRTRSLVITTQAAGTATVTLRAVDQEDAVASPVTFDVIVASPTLPAPALEPGSNSGDLEVTVVTTFGPRETRAHDYQIRVKRPQTPWHTVGCHAITNNSDGTATGPFSVILGNNPAGLTYDVRYRYRNSSSCNAGSPGPWSAVGEGISGGTAANATPAFPEGASTDRSVNENVGGGINVGSPVAALDADGGRDVLTYSLGGADAGSFQIVAATGQIRTRDGITYDHEARDTYSVTVEASDVHSETDRISVDIHIVDLGSICTSPPRLRLNSGDGGLTVRWTPLADRAASASVLGYEVERRDGTGGAWGNRQIIGGRATSNTAYTGLVNGRQYDIRIRPYGDEDACDWSAPVSGIPTTDTAPQDQPDFEDRVPPEKQLRDWRFPVPGRFSETRDGRQLDGSYRYVRTDPDRGTITFEYDEIGQSGCEVSLLFSSLTSGSFLDECEGAGVNVDVDFDIEEPPAPSSPLAPQSMEEFDGLVLGQENTILPGFGFGYGFSARLGTRLGGPASGYAYRIVGNLDANLVGSYAYESTGPNSGALTVRFGCRCPRDEWDDNNGTDSSPDEEWVFELSFLSSDAAEYTLTLYREGQPPLTLNGFIDFKAGDNLSSFPPELLPPGSPPQASGNDLFGVDAATGSTSLSIGGDSIQTILVQDGGIQDIAYQPGDWLEPKDGGNQRMMIVGPGQTSAPVAAGLDFRARTPAQVSSAAQPVVSAGQAGLIALSVVCMQIEKGIPTRGSRFFSQPKPPAGAVQMCQRNCVVAGGDTIQRCVWECEGSAESAASVVDDFGDSAMRQLLDALGGSSASEPIRTGARTRSDDLKSALPRID